MSKTLTTERHAAPPTTVNGSTNVFLNHPIQLAGFTLHAYGVTPDATPFLHEWQAAFALASSSQESSPYWVGDLLAYAESRADWQSKLDQVKSVTGLSHQTLLNQTYISAHVQERQRKLAPSYSHAAAVARLDADDQETFLARARTSGWTVRELRRAIRSTARSAVLHVLPHAGCRHTVDVTVRLTVDASSPWMAQEAAWQAIKTAIARVPHAHVISATALNPEPVGAE